jgi:hypothetical protein
MPLTKIQSLGITDGTIVNADINASAAIAGTKISGSFGKVLQVVQTVKTDTFSSTSTSLADITGLSVSITPSSTSNKIFVMYHISANSTNLSQYQLIRGTTAILKGNDAGSRVGISTGRLSTGGEETFNSSAFFLDSPSTTSSTTYKIQVRVQTGTVYINRSENDTDSATLSQRTTSSITAIEIAG